jgi:hypothetical protein
MLHGDKVLTQHSTAPSSDDSQRRRWIALAMFILIAGTVAGLVTWLG